MVAGKARIIVGLNPLHSDSKPSERDILIKASWKTRHMIKLGQIVKQLTILFYIGIRSLSSWKQSYPSSRKLSRSWIPIRWGWTHLTWSETRTNVVHKSITIHETFVNYGRISLLRLHSHFHNIERSHCRRKQPLVLCWNDDQKYFLQRVT